MNRGQLIASLETARDGLWKMMGCLEALCERSDDAQSHALLSAAKTVCSVHLELADDAISVVMRDEGNAGDPR